MARIRSIKPETWTDEKFVKLSMTARLFFIGLWNFVDDEGRCQYSPKTLKLQILPDDKVDVEKLCAELRRLSLIFIYSVNSKEYLQVTNFEKHQKIDKRRTSKLPAPNRADFPRNSTTDQGGDQGGDQGSGIKDQGSAQSTVRAQAPCDALVRLYHEHCPALPRVQKLTDARSAALKARWKDHSDLVFWESYFKRVHSSDFLCGRVAPRDGKPFCADLEWITKESNFVKILEGRYDNRGGAKNKSSLDEWLEEGKC